MSEHKYFIDTNIFLCPIVKDDFQKVKECEDFFELINCGKIKAVTSSIVLAECIWTGMSFYKISKNEMVEVLRGALKLRGLKIVDNFNCALAVELYAGHSVKFIDALIASIPLIAGGEMIAVSYDKDFDKLKIKRKEPKNV
ncbi:hypothetical protein BWK69_01070 [Candidatus Parcubacteria bacterium A4]|nr:MAG: hypothetical protein BWK69_01070 [Candidatus Parcubacteria bacterium A4]